MLLFSPACLFIFLFLPMESVRLLSSFGKPDEARLAEYLNTPGTLQKIYDSTCGIPSVHDHTEEHVIRFMWNVELPTRSLNLDEDSILTKIRLIDLLPKDHPLYDQWLGEKAKDHAWFLTDMAIHAADNPFKQTSLGLQSNILGVSLWGFEEASKGDNEMVRLMANEVFKQKSKMDRGFIYDMAPGQSIDDKNPRILRSASNRERSGLYTYGGRQFPDTKNSQRLVRGIFTLPQDLSEWSIIDTKHALYGQLLSYKVSHQKEAFYQFIKRQEENGIDKETDIDEWLKENLPLEQQVPLEFHLGNENVPEEERTTLAVVPSALLGKFAADSKTKLFYYMLQETPIEEITMMVCPINKTWCQAFLEERNNEANPYVIQLVFDLRFVSIPRDSHAVCRDVEGPVQAS